eukprot:COSAG01_NODE_8751_length_2672_cov_14.296541_3_plen_198_part_00
MHSVLRQARQPGQHSPIHGQGAVQASHAVGSGPRQHLMRDMHAVARQAAPDNEHAVVVVVAWGLRTVPHEPLPTPRWPCPTRWLASPPRRPQTATPVGSSSTDTGDVSSSTDTVGRAHTPPLIAGTRQQTHVCLSQRVLGRVTTLFLNKCSFFFLNNVQHGPQRAPPDCPRSVARASPEHKCDHHPPRPPCQRPTPI